MSDGQGSRPGEPWPHDCRTVRPAGIGDAGGIAYVHVQSWRSTYPGILPDQYLVGLSPQRHVTRWRRVLQQEAPGRRTFVAVDTQDRTAPKGGIVGFGSCGPQRTAIPGYQGEVYTLYLMEDAQGRGWGRQIMAALARDMLDAGMRSAVVWVLRDNPSRWFYERMGGVLLAEQPITFAGARLVETAYGWQDLVQLASMSADPRVR